MSGDRQRDFMNIIGDNHFTVERYLSINDKQMRRVFFFYLSRMTVLKTLTEISDQEIISEIISYMNDIPVYFNRIIRYVYEMKLPYSSLVGLLKVFGKTAVKDIAHLWVHDNMENDVVIDALQKAQQLAGLHIFPFELFRYSKFYLQNRVLDENDFNRLKQFFYDLNSVEIKKMLIDKYDNFMSSVIQVNEKELCNGMLISEIKKTLGLLYEQLSFVEEEWSLRLPNS
jgi:hypothetical protein